MTGQVNFLRHSFKLQAAKCVYIALFVLQYITQYITFPRSYTGNPLWGACAVVLCSLNSRRLDRKLGKRPPHQSLTHANVIPLHCTVIVNLPEQCLLYHLTSQSVTDSSSKQKDDEDDVRSSKSTVVTNHNAKSSKMIMAKPTICNHCGPGMTVLKG